MNIDKEDVVKLTMTEKEALKVLAREEKRFADVGFGRGVGCPPRSSSRAD